MLSWVFAYIYVMTSGGPGNSTVVSEWYIYQQVFRTARSASASAAAVTLLGFVASCSSPCASGRQQAYDDLAYAEPAAEPPQADRDAREAQALLVVFCAGDAAPVYFLLVEQLEDRAPSTSSTRTACRTSPMLSTIMSAFRGGELVRWFLNSFIFTGTSVVLSTAIAALAAYAISLMRWRPGQWLLSVLIALMVLPPIVLVCRSSG